MFQLMIGYLFCFVFGTAAIAQAPSPEAICRDGAVRNISCPGRDLRITVDNSTNWDRNRIKVFWTDNYFAEGCDQTTDYDVDVCVSPSAGDVRLRIIVPFFTSSIRKITVFSQDSQPLTGVLRLFVSGPESSLDRYQQTVLSELAVDPLKPVHVVFGGTLSNFGRIVCGAIGELTLVDDRVPNTTTVGSMGYRLIPYNTTDLSPIVLVQTAVVSPTYPLPIGIERVVATALSANTTNVEFLPRVVVENGPINNWNFPSNWIMRSPQFSVTHNPLGVVRNFSSGNFGPWADGVIDSQIFRIESMSIAGTGPAASAGMAAFMRVNSLSRADGMGGVTVRGLLYGAVDVDNLMTNCTINQSSPSDAAGSAGLAPTAFIRIGNFAQGSSLQFPNLGLRGQVIINKDANGGSWEGAIRYSVNNQQFVLASAGHPLGVYDVPSVILGGGAVGLVPFQLYAADCVPASRAGAAGALSRAGFLARDPVSDIRVRFFGPVISHASNPPATGTGRIQSVFTVEQQQQDVSTGLPVWANVTGSFEQSLPGTQGGREVVLRLKSNATPAELLPFQNSSLFRVKLFPQNSAATNLLFCDKLTTSTPVLAAFPTDYFYFWLGCGPSGQPNPADVSGGVLQINYQFPDGIVDGSDYTAFINSFSAGNYAEDKLADINLDGVIDGTDFTLFISNFSAGC